ncbi:MAG: TonB-dependent receptor [Bacteroidetes bacterium]|nr:TonB-dependent receptor [Bacteroidota bacterium]
MKRLLCLIGILASISSSVFAQKKLTISGYVKDAQSGEALIGATVGIPAEGAGATTNVYGFYSLSIDPGKYQVVYSYVGFESRTITIELGNESMKKDIELSVQAVEADAVIIQAERADKNVKSTEMSKVELSKEMLQEIPVLFGETDVIKTIQLLPGIQSTGDGNSGFYVRGGGPDQNLILLDEAVVYNASHLFGFFSVFSADAIKNVTITKGGIPAEYGGRLSSVLNVTLKEGNNKYFDAEGGVGIISSRLLFEGPIIKNKSSFMVAGRRTYADALVQPFLNDDIKGNRYYFYDLNTKLNYTFSPKDRLLVSGYFGRDVFKFEDQGSASENPPQFNSDWGNTTLTARWNHLFSDKLFANTVFIYNDFNFTFGAGFNDFNFEVRSAIKDLTLKMDYQYFAGPETDVKFGVSAIHHTFNPSAVDVNFGQDEINVKAPDRLALEYATYAQIEHDLGSRLNINAGLRFSAFNAIGPYRDPVYDQVTDQPTGDTAIYDNWESIQWYQGLEPRFAARYLINTTTSLKGSFTKTNQYLHLASVSGGTLPTDLWLPSSKYIKPQVAWQGAVGLFKNFTDNTYETSIEMFYKPMQNQIDFAPGTNLFFADNIDRSVLAGDGLAYGAEFFVKKAKGKFTGWIGYTWSKTTRTILELSPNPYFPRYDRRHDVSVLASYRFNKAWSTSAVFVYATGIAYTPSMGRFFGYLGIDFDGPADLNPQVLLDVITIYPDDFNNYRLRPYNRVDFSVNYKPQPKIERAWSGSWNFSVFNAFNRKNPYFVYDDTNIEEGINERKMIYFPVIPSITYNFKF